MASKWLQQSSYGQTDVMYAFGLRPEPAAEVSALINAAARTFHGECDSRWRDSLMTAHVNALADMLLRHRALTNRMFRSGDPLLVEMEPPDAERGFLILWVQPSQLMTDTRP